MLNAVHDSIDDIPEQFRELYTEKNGKFELTGISGVKTPADIERLTTSLEKERNDHKATKELLAPWRELDHTDVMSKLDRFPELEAAAKGKLNETEIEEIVARRVEGTINSKTAPLEREITTLRTENSELAKKNENFEISNIRRTITDDVREALVKAQVLSPAQNDALLLAERVFEVSADGVVVTKDQVGVTPGVTPDVWLQEIQPTRPHWWGESVGGGAGGGRNAGSVGDNPWSKDHWNVTRQAEIVKTQGMEKAQQVAKLAGSEVGATTATK